MALLGACKLLLFLNTVSPEAFTILEMLLQQCNLNQGLCSLDLKDALVLLEHLGADDSAKKEDEATSRLKEISNLGDKGMTDFFQREYTHAGSDGVKVDKALISKLQEEEVHEVVIREPVTNRGAMLRRAATWEFNVFVLAEQAGEENILPLVANYIFSMHDFFGMKGPGGGLNREVMRAFLEALSKRFAPTTPFFSTLRAADATQALYYLVHTCHFERAYKPELMLAAYLAVLIHNVVRELQLQPHTRVPRLGASTRLRGQD